MFIYPQSHSVGLLWLYIFNIEWNRSLTAFIKNNLSGRICKLPAAEKEDFSCKDTIKSLKSIYGPNVLDSDSSSIQPAFMCRY